MPSYILTWNPENFAWEDLPDYREELLSGRSVELTWSSGSTKTIPVGSRVFMLKQGPEPRGLVAAGWTTTPVRQGPHWDSERASKGDVANFVTFSLDWLIDPEEEDPLDPRGLPPGPASQAHWTPAGSGISLAADAAEQLDRLWEEYTGAAEYVASQDPDASALEGEVRVRLGKHRLRERSLRQAKLASALIGGRLRCEVPGCGFDFEERYGMVGRGYAQVHHLKPLASFGAPERTRLEDLAVLCANCHVMVHLGGQCRSLEELIPAQPQLNGSAEPLMNESEP